MDLGLYHLETAQLLAKSHLIFDTLEHVKIDWHEVHLTLWNQICKELRRGSNERTLAYRKGPCNTRSSPKLLDPGQ